MSVYRVKFRLRNAEVDLNRRLRLSTMFRMMQEASIAHTEELGAGREKTLDRGLLWVVTLQDAWINRMPEYDEEITLESWPGDTMHLFFPRYYRLLGADGSVLVTASALWVLMDSVERKMVFPEDKNVAVPFEKTGFEPALPRAPRHIATTGEAAFTVPFSYTDMNGHMNNTRYFDLMEDTLPPELHSKRLTRIGIEYRAEARLGDEFKLRWGNEGTDWFLSGETDKQLFKMRMTYE